MTGLAEWLLEAITEDERDARDAMTGHTTGEWTLDGSIYAGHPTGEVVDWVYGEAWAHIARWDPARVLAECAAKRAIIELHGHEDAECWEMHRGVYGPGWPEGSGRVEGQAWAHPSLEYREQEPCDTLRLLAAPYADRPGFRKEWRV